MNLLRSAAGQQKAPQMLGWAGIIKQIFDLFFEIILVSTHPKSVYFSASKENSNALLAYVCLSLGHLVAIHRTKDEVIYVSQNSLIVSKNYTSL